MLNAWGVPAHVIEPKVYFGVTVIVATTGLDVELLAANDVIFPEPVAAKPIDASLLIQSYVVATPLKLITVVFAPLQTSWFAGATTLGVGLTVMLNVFEGPGQELYDGVTVIFAVCGVDPLFVAGKFKMLPVPVAARPMLVLSFVHENIAPAVPLKLTSVLLMPLQTTWLLTALTVGVGSTVMVNDVVGPLQGPADGVTTTVATTGAAPVFTAVNGAMLPVPFAAKPIDGLSLVHENVDAPVPVKLTAAVLTPLQRSWLPTPVTEGEGCTVIVKVCIAPVHVTEP